MNKGTVQGLQVSSVVLSDSQVDSPQCVASYIGDGSEVSRCSCITSEWIKFTPQVVTMRLASAGLCVQPRRRRVSNSEGWGSVEQSLTRLKLSIMDSKYRCKSPLWREIIHHWAKLSMFAIWRDFSFSLLWSIFRRKRKPFTVWKCEDSEFRHKGFRAFST